MESRSHRVHSLRCILVVPLDGSDLPGKRGGTICDSQWINVPNLINLNYGKEHFVSQLYKSSVLLSAPKRFHRFWQRFLSR